MIHKVGRKSFANIQVVLSFYTDCENWSAMAKGALTVKVKQISDTFVLISTLQAHVGRIAW